MSSAVLNCIGNMGKKGHECMRISTNSQTMMGETCKGGNMLGGLPSFLTLTTNQGFGVKAKAL